MLFHLPSLRPVLYCILFMCGLAACGSDTTQSASDAANKASGSTETSASNGNVVLTPSLEVGPYYVDEELNRSNVVSDSNTGVAQDGAALTLNIYVHEVTGADTIPYVNVVVDMWEANAAGKYSDESAESTSGANWLRGLQVADANGLVSFATLVPGWYAGLAPHIHLALRKTTGTGVTLKFSTRAFFDDAFIAQVFANAPYSAHTGQDTFTTNDRLFNETCTSGSTTFKCGSATLLKPTETASGYEATLHLYVDPLGDTAASNN